MDEWMGSNNQQLGVSTRGKTLGRSVLAYNWTKIQRKGVFFSSLLRFVFSFFVFVMVLLEACIIMYSDGSRLRLDSSMGAIPP